MLSVFDAIPGVRMKPCTAPESRFEGCVSQMLTLCEHLGHLEQVGVISPERRGFSQVFRLSGLVT